MGCVAALFGEFLKLSLFFRLFKWCPAPGCLQAIKVREVESQPVKCSCELVFCYGCGDEKWHVPISCKMNKKWSQKCNEDSETVQWMNQNTKDCPKCYLPIEKNGGCNHMVCYHGSCKYHFCWVSFTQCGNLRIFLLFTFYVK